jgi:hypothetical protein
MSAGSHPSSNLNLNPNLPQGPDVMGDVLGELLHCLSQPLTSLRCSLELSIDEVPERQQKGVWVALQNTEKVIGMVQLMREYLDAERPAPQLQTTALAPVLRSVIEEMSSIADVRGVRVRLVGTCTATVPVLESRLRLALQYLVAATLESQLKGGRVLLLLGEGPAGAVLRVEGECPSATAPSIPVSTLRPVRLAIASRVLETAGASLVFSISNQRASGPSGFVLRIPRRAALSLS